MNENFDILILGCGYTGERVAKRLLAKGARVTATTRDPGRLVLPGAEIIATSSLSAHVRPGMLVLHSIPPDGPKNVLDPLMDNARRLVYLSSTAVYGAATSVDEMTPAVPTSEQGTLRLEAERRIAGGPWSTLILRPAAIYGPGRGVHESVRRGRYSLDAGFVSRIHVDDLALHVEAALLSDLRGAYPVADESPCSSREISEFCAQLLNVAVSAREGVGRAPRFAENRKVDGSAIRRALGIQLLYPSYRVGIPATLKAEIAALR